MKKKKTLFILFMALILAVLIVFAFLDLRPLSIPFQYDFASQRLQLIENRHDEIPAYLSIPAGLISLFASYMLTAFLIPQRIRKVVDSLPRTKRGWLQTTLLGLAAGFVLFFIMLTSILGPATFPASLLIGVGLFAAGTFGNTAISLAAGQFILERFGLKTCPPYQQIFLGTLLMLALISIPVAGILFMIIYFSLGLGLSIFTHFGSGHAWSLNLLQQEEK